MSVGAAVLGAAALVILTRWWGLALERRGTVLLLAHGEPLAGPIGVRLGGGTVRVVVLATAAVIALPVAARRLRWRPLLAGGTVAAAAWSVGLASTDGWRRGFVARLASRDQYPHDVGRVHADLLHVFVGGINGHDGLLWTTHVAGHPPGALLTFWLLARVGLPGPGPAAVLCVVGGAAMVPAVLITVKSLAGEPAARRVAPFLVLAPAAIWLAVSADAWFAGVTAWGIAGLAVAAARTDRTGDLAAFGGGILLGLGLYLSYGLVLLAPVVVAVVAGRRRVRPLVVAALGVAGVVAAVTAAGFWWWSGLTATATRVAAGAAGARPYGYFLLADPAALAVAIGPATVAALTLARRDRLAWLPLSTGAALLLADVAGLSRGEVERIWLPFMPWLIVATAWLPPRSARGWLAAQAGLAIVVQTVVVGLW